LAATSLFDYYAIVPHVDQPLVLLLPEGERWSLPHWTTPERHYWHVTEPVIHTVRHRLGLETTVLRCIENRRDAVTGHVQRGYALENHSPSSWAPPAGARWVGEKELSQLHLEPPEHVLLLRDWFADHLPSEAPAKRVPWAREGWFDEASAWIQTRLARAGLAVTGPIAQERTWQRSCVLRAPVTGGRVYFKAVPEMFAHEPRLTRELAQQYPKLLPEVLAVDSERRWLLMRDCGGKSLDRLEDIHLWEEALRTFARLQIGTAAHTDRWLAMGCPDRRLDHLAESIDPLVVDPAVLLPGDEEGLSESEIDQLRGAAPRLKAMCAELAGYRVPHSLEHGDFHAGQVLVGDGRFVYLDWSDSSVAHPFYCMFLFFAYTRMEECLAAHTDMRARLRDAYLEPWTVYEPMERLREAFEISQRLAALHIATMYQQAILPNLEDRNEWQAMAPWCLKLLLRQL
jgi:hypothetical protein